MLSPIESALVALLLMVLMFGLGTTLSVERFHEIVAQPRAVLLGLGAQFGWMPLLAYLLARGLDLAPATALGLVITGACPGGTTSNMFAYYARADIALSVSTSAASKLLGVVLMPLCLLLYARSITDQAIAVPYADIVKMLLLLLLPVALGIWLQRLRGPSFARSAERVASAVGLLVIALVVSLSLARNAHLLATIQPSMYAASALLGLLGMLAGYLIARATRLPEAQRRALTLQTGIQNCPLAFAVITTSFQGTQQADMLKVPMLYALLVLFEACAVTLYYRFSAGAEVTPKERTPCMD
jgi:BASS family bile acid:Na+ symporter